MNKCEQGVRDEVGGGGGGLRVGGWGCAFHFTEIFHLVEIRSVFCLYFQGGLEFFY